MSWFRSFTLLVFRLLVSQIAAHVVRSDLSVRQNTVAEAVHCETSDSCITPCRSTMHHRSLIPLARRTRSTTQLSLMWFSISPCLVAERRLVALPWPALVNFRASGGAWLGNCVTGRAALAEKQ